MQNPQTQPGQYLQISSATPQLIQNLQPQVIQAQPLLQTIQSRFIHFNSTLIFNLKSYSYSANSNCHR
jgi:hypothetical protein